MILEHQDASSWALQKLSQASLVPRPIILYSKVGISDSERIHSISALSDHLSLPLQHNLFCQVYKNVTCNRLDMTQFGECDKRVNCWTSLSTFQPTLSYSHQISCQKLGKSIPVKGQSTQKHWQVNKTSEKNVTSFFHLFPSIYLHVVYTLQETKLDAGKRLQFAKVDTAAVSSTPHKACSNSGVKIYY